MHRQLFKLLSRKADCVKSVCKDRNSPFYFACRRWIFYNESN